MNVCKTCGCNCPDNSKFCNNCGNPLYTQIQAYAYQNQPNNLQNQNGYNGFGATNYGYNYMQPTPPRPGRGLGISGMILGILSIMSGFGAIIFSIGAIVEADSGRYIGGYYYGPDEESLLLWFFCSLFVLLQSITGLVLSNMSRKKGDFTGISQSGKVMGIIATAFSGLAVLLAIIALCMM